MYRGIVATLGVWRITHLLHAEDGPWDVVVRLRRRVGSGFWGGLMDCFNCLSMWPPAVFAYCTGRTWRERLLLWPALSAGAVLIEDVRSGRQPALYQED